MQVQLHLGLLMMISAKSHFNTKPLLICSFQHLLRQSKEKKKVVTEGQRTAHTRIQAGHLKAWKKKKKKKKDLTFLLQPEIELGLSSDARPLTSESKRRPYITTTLHPGKDTLSSHTLTVLGGGRRGSGRNLMALWKRNTRQIVKPLSRQTDERGTKPQEHFTQESFVRRCVRKEKKTVDLIWKIFFFSLYTLILSILQPREK